MTMIETPPGYRATLEPMTPEDERVTAALDAVWKRVRELNPGVPGVVIKIGAGPDTSHSGVGWDEPVPVLRLGLMRGDHVATAGELLEVLLHHAAHAITGPTMTTEGLYHSSGYRDTAGQLGLIAEPVSTERKVGGSGWSKTSLARGTLGKYRAETAALTRALARWQPTDDPRAHRDSRNGVVASCSCTPPRKIRMRSGFDLGPVVCGVCGEPFRIAEAAR
ncbi:MAG: hypothetical protein ACRDRJ_10190 [Streptosporangiaceae bacterium]